MEGKPQICLSRTKTAFSATGTPLVFRATKDTSANPDDHSQRTIDFTLMRTASSSRGLQPRVDILLPHPNASIITTPMLPKRPPMVQDIKSYFRNVERFFFQVMQDEGIEIPKAIAGKILDAIIEQMTNLVHGAAQESRRRTNYYAKPPVDRDVTACPAMSHHFLSVEQYYSNCIRRKHFQVQDDYYEPYYYTEPFDQSKNSLFNQEGSTEALENKYQHVKIFQVLTARGVMTKSVAKEPDQQNYVSEMDTLLTRMKNQAQAKPTPTFSVKAAEVFAGKETEEKRLERREITVADIFAYMNSCGPRIRQQVPVFMLARLNGWEDAVIDEEGE